MAWRNYIDESERRFLESAYLTALGDLWTSNATLSSDPITFQDASFGSLRVSGEQNAEISFNEWANPAVDVPSQYAITDVDDVLDIVESFVWIRPTKNCTITFRSVATVCSYDSPTQKYMLSTDLDDVYKGTFSTKTVEYGNADNARWFLVRANKLRLPEISENQRFSLALNIHVDFAEPGGEVNISRPTITLLGDIETNIFAFSTWANIPEVFFDQDNSGLPNAVSFPMLRLIDVATSSADTVYTRIRDIDYANSENFADPNDLETRSTLVNPTVAYSIDVLRWLSHFRGRELLVTYEPSTEGQEWDEFVLDSSLLDSTSVLASTNIPSTGFSGGTEAYFRWQVETGYYGHNGGTITALIASAQLLLSGNKTVDYEIDAQNRIIIKTSITETYASDLLGLNIGDSNPFIVKVMEPARPLGMIVLHELTA